jgi:hypothetical protein
MVTAAINILIYTVVFFLIGMYKPNWALFFMKKPDRFMVMVVSVVLFMVATTLFGEGTQQKKSAKNPVAVVSEDSVPVVVSPSVQPEKVKK